MKSMDNAVEQWLTTSKLPDSVKANLRAAAARLDTMPKLSDRERAARGCPYGLCGGARFVSKGAPFGHPDFGKAFPCKCNTQAVGASPEVIAELRGHMTKTEQTYTLRNWAGTDPDAHAAAVSALRRGYGQYVFWGAVGTGKSGLLNAIVTAALDKGVAANYQVVPEMLNDLRRAQFNPDPQKFFIELERIKSAPILALDEMWRYKASEWAQNTMFEILDYRYRHWGELLTLFATNIQPDAGDSDPIMSRLADSEKGILVEVKGGNLRPIIKEILETRDEGDFWEMDIDAADLLGAASDEKYGGGL